MGKRMGMRGRPGLLFVVILVIFLMIFFMTWKSMMTPTKRTEVKDMFSFHNGGKQSRIAANQPHSDLNDIWHHGKLVNEQKLDGQGAGNDEDYNGKITVKENNLRPKHNVEHVKSPLSDHLHAKLDEKVMKQTTKPYYRKQSDTLKIIGGRMNRFVHLDLKGAAPKLSYFKEVLPLLSRLGANGLLIEYEDMFPYWGAIQNVSAKNAYSRDQIEELLELATLNSLQVIPLIQTFGHMEFALKSLDLTGLRESEYTPQVIDITSDSSYKLIQKMVEQVIELHPSASYIHIGCDEVYELGKGRSSDTIIRDKVTPEKLFLKHVTRVASIVANAKENKVRPIMWDDELRKMAEEDIVASGLPKAVDIMVWKYTQNISDSIGEDVWMKYGRVFKTVWAASSFKGATGSRQLYTEPQHHIINHFSWLDVIEKYGQYVSFKGIALTGWQRYDHFATLCELFPVALPSLAVCLATIRNGGFDEGIHLTTSSTLGCSRNIEMGFPYLNKKERKALVSQDCRFPGYMVYYAVQQLWGYKQFEEQDRRSGWLSNYQLKRGFTNPGQLKVLSMRLSSLHGNLVHIRQPLEDMLGEIYSSDTVEEWVEENIIEMQSQIKEEQAKIKEAFKNTHWARRPLPPPSVVMPRAVTPKQVIANKNVNPERTNQLALSNHVKQPLKEDSLNSNVDLLRNSKTETIAGEYNKAKYSNLMLKNNPNLGKQVQFNDNRVLREDGQRNVEYVNNNKRPINGNANVFASNVDQNDVKNLDISGLKSNMAAVNSPRDTRVAGVKGYQGGKHNVRVRTDDLRLNLMNGQGDTMPIDRQKPQQLFGQKMNPIPIKTNVQNSPSDPMNKENLSGQVKNYGNVLQPNAFNVESRERRENPLQSVRTRPKNPSPFQDIEMSELNLKNDGINMKFDNFDKDKAESKTIMDTKSGLFGKRVNDAENTNHANAMFGKDENSKPQGVEPVNSLSMREANVAVPKSDHLQGYNVNKEEAATNANLDLYRKNKVESPTQSRYDDLEDEDADNPLDGKLVKEESDPFSGIRYRGKRFQQTLQNE